MTIFGNRLSAPLSVIVAILMAACSSFWASKAFADHIVGNQFVFAKVSDDGYCRVTWYKGDVQNVNAGKQLSFVNKSYLHLLIDGLYYSNNDLAPTLIGPPQFDTKKPPDVLLNNGSNRTIGDTVFTTWRESGFDVVQMVYPVEFTKSGQMVLRVKIVNHVNKSMNVQAEYLLDIDPQNDKAKVLTRWGYSPNWTAYPTSSNQKAVPPFFMAFQNAPGQSGFPGLTGTGYVTDTMAPTPLGLMPPTFLLVGGWVELSYFKWGYPDQYLNTAYGDNAILYQWDSKGVPPNNGIDSTQEVATVSYGTGEFCENFGQVYAMLLRPGQLNYDPHSRKYKPNPFNVEAIIFNMSSVSAIDAVKATLTVTGPLHIVAPPTVPPLGQSKTISLNPSSIAPYDVGDAFWSDSTFDVLKCPQDAAYVSLDVTGSGLSQAFVDSWDCPTYIPCTTVDTIPPAATLKKIATGRYDTSTCSKTLTFSVFDSLPNDRGLKNITYTVQSGTFKVTIAGGPLPAPDCPKTPYTVSVTQTDSIHDGCIDFVFTDCAGNISTATTCFCAHPLPTHFDVLPPKFWLKSFADTCARCNMWAVADSESVAYDSGVNSLVVKAASNMTLNLLQVMSGKDKVDSFTVCPKDTMFSGFITLEATDNAKPAHVTDTTLHFCTTPDTQRPTISVFPLVVNQWPIVATDTQAWDRGIDHVVIGGINNVAVLPQAHVGKVQKIAPDTVWVFPDTTCPHVFTFNVMQIDTFEAAGFCARTVDCAGNVTLNDACNKIGPKTDAYNPTVDCGMPSGAPPGITVKISDTHLTAGGDTINYDLGIDSIWFADVYNMSWVSCGPDGAVYHADSGKVHRTIFPGFSPPQTGKSHPAYLKDTSLCFRVTNPSAVDSDQACVTVLARDHAGHIASCHWCYQITQDVNTPFIRVDNPTLAALQVTVTEDSTNDRGIDSIWIDPNNNFQPPFVFSFPPLNQQGSSKYEQKELDRATKDRQSAFAVLHANDWSGKVGAHQNSVPVWIYIQDLIMDADRIDNNPGNFTVPVRLAKNDNIPLAQKGIWDYQFTFHLQGSPLVSFLKADPTNTLSSPGNGWTVTTTTNPDGSFTVHGNAMAGLAQPLAVSGTNDTLVKLIFSGGQSDTLGVSTITIDGGECGGNPDHGAVTYNGGKDTIFTDNMRSYYVDLAAPIGCINGGKIFFKGACTPVAGDGTIPTSISIAPITPNPVDAGNGSASIHIQYTVATDGPVRLQLYNALGEPVRTLVAQDQRQGEYNLTLDAAPLPEGAYFLRLEAGGNVAARRMILTKR